MNTILPQMNLKIGVKRTIIVENYPHELTKTDLKICEKVYTNKINDITELHTEANKVKRYFLAWKQYVRDKQKKLENFNKHLQQSEKLEAFIKSLRKIQRKSANKIVDESNPEKYSKKCIKETQFLHRFQAQKEIIQMQKNKLREQKYIIDQLKLGNLEDAVKESMTQARMNVTDILQNCSVKVKCKIRSSVFLENINKDLLELGIKSDKVPKIIREMEQRALDREQKRRLISDRKKIMDAAKKEAFEINIMEKKSQDEENRKKCMEELQKRREAQLKYYRQVKLNREKTLQDTAKANDFYERKLKQATFVVLHKLIRIRRNNFIKSKVYYEMRLIRKGFKCWKRFLEEIEYRRNYNVLQLYNYKMKKKLFFAWFKIYTLSIQHVQVAEDFYTMQLEHKVFNYWHCYTCTQQFIEKNNMQRAQRHYQNWVLLHYFYQWKSLPAVIALEKAKEAKKRKWREKVWEILPDYKPVIDNSY
ncbi:hypothetical protein RN001_012652 [Aquatica leii]|uniref:Uncharacterized protein n=1 Tax=Aquatica leii TaxID=1421715 RepID=A0AAN7Q1U3_9COLE|nr:hypothetical protein RN001_012652 [Aquatica leii]